MEFDLEQTDALLSTTRAVRKRLDLERPVPRSVISDCLTLATQAPTGSNLQAWRWICIDDDKTKKELAQSYREAAEPYLRGAHEEAIKKSDRQNERIFSSSLYLVDHLHEVPVHVIPCVEGRPPADASFAWLTGVFGSIYPAIWSFQLALRARGLGSTITGMHVGKEKEVAELLGVPDNVMQVALLPVGYTIGTDFKPAKRHPVSDFTHWNRWGE